MKTLFFAIIILTAASGCQREEKKVTIEKEIHHSGGDVWAEKAISQTAILMPEGWSEEDWNNENKIENEKIFNTIMEAVYAGNLKAFDPITDSPLSVDDVKNRFSRVDTNFVEDMNKPGKPEMKISKMEISSKDVSRIDMSEKWFFDEKSFSINKKVESLTFLKSKLTESGEFMGHIALLKVKLN